MRRASSRSPFWQAANSSACRSAVTLPMPEIAPSAPSRNDAMSDIVNDDSIATGRRVARSALRLASYATMSFDQSFTATTWGIVARRARRVGEPAQMLAVGRLVDGQVRLEGQDVGGHDPRELQRLAHDVVLIFTVGAPSPGSGARRSANHRSAPATVGESPVGDSVHHLLG